MIVKKLIFAFLFFFLFVPQTMATSIVEMDLADLTEYAETIFVGTVKKAETVTNEKGTPTHTQYHVAVHRVVKGKVLEKEVSFQLKGGESNGLLLQVPGMPQLEEGGKYLLFFSAEKDVYCPILGWWQGKYEIVVDKRSGREILLDGDGRRVTAVEGGKALKSLGNSDSSFSLSSFVLEINSIMSGPKYRDKSRKMYGLQKDLLQTKGNKILFR